MNITKIILTITIIPLVVSLNACSVFRPVGQENFDCNGKKSTDPYCRSFKGVDRSTTGEIPDTKFDAAFNYVDRDKYMGDYVDSNGKPTKEATQAAANGTLPHEITGAGASIIPGAPVRQVPVVQKIWVNRYVDGSDKLHQPVEIYQEVIGSRWSGFLPAQQAKSNAEERIYPHYSEKKLNSNAASTGAVQTNSTEDRSNLDGALEERTVPMPAVENGREQPSNPQ